MRYNNKITISKALEHLKTITYHKNLVMVGCFKVGLYYQGLTHDLSKYYPVEFKVGIEYYQGDRSPNNAEREKLGYSAAWLHHKGRNKHHYEYWIDYTIRNTPTGLAPAPMPTKYIVEMVMDRMAASKVYKKSDYTSSSPYEYYAQATALNHLMHPKTRRLLELLLKALSSKGEKLTYNFIRNIILPYATVLDNPITESEALDKIEDMANNI